MALPIEGQGGQVLQVDASHRAARVTLRPDDHGTLGHYVVCHTSGTMAAGLAANAAIFQFRWTDATRLALIQNVTLAGMAGSATAFAAGFAKIDMMVARAYSAQAASGTALTPTGNSAKMRTNMGTSLATLIQGSATAALTPGTHTLDAFAVGLTTWSIGTVVNTIYRENIVLFGEDKGVIYPLVLTATGGGEGFILRASVPATGTWQFGVIVRWAEVTAYDNTQLG